jgi:hypothetical protein
VRACCLGGVSVITEKGDITTSYLLIQRARPSDSGKYICLPSNANSETINVHVLNGEFSAAAAAVLLLCMVTGEIYLSVI